MVKDRVCSRDFEATLPPCSCLTLLYLVLESDVVACFLDFQEMKPSPMQKVYAEVERLSEWSSAQSESEKPEQVRAPPSRSLRVLVKQR